MQTMDRSHWQRVNPLLDELMDLAPARRAERLAVLAAQDPALAAELSDMLQRLDALEQHSFLQHPVRVPAPALAGHRVAAYTLVRELGRGGMGSVWLAQRADGHYDGQVAIKFLSGESLRPGSAERFAREGRILARLAHPHIARLMDAGVSPEGLRYLVLDYVEGEIIDRYCLRQGLDVAARVRLFIDVLAAVAHAHTRLILHRDIKPGNILVTAAGEVKLLDFGVAKLVDDTAVPAEATELTQLAGRAYTPAYAAPEQVDDGDVTTATDVYALGVLLYGLLGGGHPTKVPGSTTLQQLRAVVEAVPARLSEAAARLQGARQVRELRGDLDNIVAKALKKRPAERYANAQQMADDLTRYLQHEPVSARPDAPVYVLTKFVRRHRAGVAAGAGVLLAVGLGLSVALWEAHEARHQRVQAEGLIEFMLGDLRKRLQPVGRLDALDAVGARALGYYAAQDADRLDADSLGRKARALHLIGELADRRGKLEEAQQVFQQASDSTAELLARTPQDPQRLFDHAQSLFWVGQAGVRRGDLMAARAAFGQYLQLAQRLRQQDPARREWQEEEAHAYGNLGILQVQEGRPREALVTLQAAQQRWVPLAVSQPALQWERANVLGWVAKAQEAQGDYLAASAAQGAKLEALHAMPDAASSRRVQDLQANGHYQLARLHLMLGQSAQAVQAAEVAQQHYAALVGLDSSNADWRAQLALAYGVAAQALRSQGQESAAQARQAQALAVPLPWADATAAPKNKWFLSLAGPLAVLQVRGHTDPAWSAADAALQAFVQQASTGALAGAGVRSEHEWMISEAELLLGDRLEPQAAAAARQHWQAVATRMAAEHRGGAEPARWALLAQAYLRLGQVAQAQALATRIESTPYRHPVYADLRQRLALLAGGEAGLLTRRNRS